MNVSIINLFGVNPAAREVKCGVEWLRGVADAGDVPHYRDSFGRRFFDAAGVRAAKELYQSRIARSIASRR
jgi:hypothetical protein